MCHFLTHAIKLQQFHRLSRKTIPSVIEISPDQRPLSHQRLKFLNKYLEVSKIIPNFEFGIKSATTKKKAGNLAFRILKRNTTKNLQLKKGINPQQVMRKDMAAQRS